jgi:hypothetical protein
LYVFSYVSVTFVCSICPFHYVRISLSHSLFRSCYYQASLCTFFAKTFLAPIDLVA